MWSGHGGGSHQIPPDQMVVVFAWERGVSACLGHTCRAMGAGWRCGPVGRVPAWFKPQHNMNKTRWSVLPSTQNVEAIRLGVQGHPCIHYKFKANLVLKKNIVRIDRCHAPPPPCTK